MEQTIKLASMKATGKRKRDVGVVFDSMADFVAHCRALPSSKRIGCGSLDWFDGDSYDRACDKAENGDLSRVASSDKLLDKLEDAVSFATRQLVTVDDVCGGVPNVGAYLAGAPLNMRRRQRVVSQGAPLNVVVDLGSSAMISAETLQKRGAALLAFVRIVSTQRPVNLYMGVAFSPYSAAEDIRCGALAIRVDTSPLDLARAAYALGSAGFPRQLTYSALMAATGSSNTDSLPFPYYDIEFYRKNMHAFWARYVSTDAEETAIVAPLYGTDDFRDAESWLRDMLKKYASVGE